MDIAIFIEFVFFIRLENIVMSLILTIKVKLVGIMSSKYEWVVL